MIRIELEVTPEQLIAIGQILKAEPIEAEPVQEQPQPEPPRAVSAKFPSERSAEMSQTLKRWRLYHGFTQSEAAGHFGVSQYIWHVFEHPQKHRGLGQASKAMLVLVYEKIIQTSTETP